MLKILRFFWDKTKTQPDVWFFYGFLLTFSLSVRKVMLYFPIKRTFNEYTGAYIYLSDIFLFLAIGSWLLILLSTNLTKLSNYYFELRKKRDIRAYIKHIIGIDKPWTKGLIHSLYWILPAFLVVLSFISIVWSHNESIALFRSFKMLELFLLYMYILQRLIKPFFEDVSDFKENLRVKEGSEVFICEEKAIKSFDSETSYNCSTWNNYNIFFLMVVFVGLSQSIVAISQFIFQHSLGLSFLRESLIDPNLSGVAKVIFADHKLIRAYGLLPHSNILGGFLVFSIVVSFLYYKLFHVEQVEYYGEIENTKSGATAAVRSCSGEKCSTWNNRGMFCGIWASWLKVAKSVNRLVQSHHIFDKIWKIEKKRLVVALILVQLLALLLTFSKSAILALMIAFGYIMWRSAGTLGYKKTMPDCFTCLAGRRAWNNITSIRVIVLSILIIFFSGWLFLKPDLDSIFFQSLDERGLYLNVSRGTIAQNPILGVGMGQFVIDMQKYSPINLQSWQYQPVHNVFLLVWSELGLIGLIIFLLWIGFIIFGNCSTPASTRGDCSSTRGGWNNLWISRFQRLKNILTKGVLNKQKWGSLKKQEKCGDLNMWENKGENDVSQKYSTREGEYILEHNNDNSSIRLALICFEGILLGFLFIMLFDHYFWDIWQGQVLFWMVVGVIVGIRRKC